MSALSAESQVGDSNLKNSSPSSGGWKPEIQGCSPEPVREHPCPTPDQFPGLCQHSRCFLVCGYNTPCLLSHSRGISLCEHLCSSPPFHGDPSPTGLEPLTSVRPHLNSTSYICKDLFSESGHILRSSESELQYMSFQGGLNSTHKVTHPLPLHSPQRSLGRLRTRVGGGHI